MNRFFCVCSILRDAERYEVCFRIQFECGKILTRKTPNTDNFYAVSSGNLLNKSEESSKNLYNDQQSTVFKIYFPDRISPYSFRMRENTDQKNSEYGHFSRSDYCHYSVILALHFPRSWRSETKKQITKQVNAKIAILLDLY